MWLQIIQMEQRCGNYPLLRQLLAEAITECPKDGELWVLAIENEPRGRRHRKASTAMETVGNNSYVMNAIARIFWLEMKKEKAVSWFERSLISCPTNGDTWAYSHLI
jgi:pre-mRNA-processing factor 6